MCSSDLWAAAGRNECETYARALVCDAEVQPPRSVNVLEQMRDSRVALDTFGAIYATKHRHLRAFNANHPRHPRQTANGQLGPCADVLLHEELYVATEVGIEAVAGRPVAAAKALSRRLPVGADDVVAGPDAGGDRARRSRTHPIVTAPVGGIAPARPGAAAIWYWTATGGCGPRAAVHAGRRVAAFFDRSLLVIGDRHDPIALLLDDEGTSSGGPCRRSPWG